MPVDRTAKPRLSSAEMSLDDKQSDDHTFQLYDLRVEVVCPAGKRILCGAKSGDHFTLEGELLKLPLGQGFSLARLVEHFHCYEYACQH